ncbi:hypothetical protein G5V65_21005 [Rhodobacter sp. HX-7-19]|uniref:Uncharacterized protein n=1 Tax=Paragemmobacter kunshanensis TaxID=2583234 RepID=A0A6M1TSR8_9RHOB|nr:hypothetical protein [Rhodobacter kunshanensis]
MEAIVARRGDLVAVQHDLLSELAGSGRIVDWTLDGSGDVDTITIDCEVAVANEPDFLSVTDLLAVEDVLLIGATSGVIIRGPDGLSSVIALDNTTGQTAVLELATPIPAADVYAGALVSIGRTGQEALRLVVFAVDPQEDFTASLTLVDEAPEIWA